MYVCNIVVIYETLHIHKHVCIYVCIYTGIKYKFQSTQIA